MIARSIAWKLAALTLAASLGIRVAPAIAQEITVATAAPVVVKTIPQAGSTDVDSALAEIRVTFSKDMKDGSFSFVKASDRSFPKIAGQIRFDKPAEPRTCVLPVKLEPGRDYAVWINTERFRGFSDANGRPAVPYLLVFRTKGAAAQADAPRPNFAAAFDALANDMSRYYSYFDLKGIDWKALTSQYRSRAVEARSSYDFVTVLREMLGHLKDGHVWIDEAGQRLSTSPAPMPPGNVNRQVVLSALEDAQPCGDFAVVGLVKGYRWAAVALTNQARATSEAVEQVTEFIQRHHDAPGLLLDLRSANGGNEFLARRIASRFCQKDVVYARSQVRSGPNPTDLTAPRDRVLNASDRPFTAPVVCLIGPGCVSSGEGFAKMMKALPNVTLVGARTRGSSGNPAPFALPGLDVVVWYSRWVDLLPDGTSVEDRGIAPDLEVSVAPEQYREADPTWTKALDLLASKVQALEAN